MNKIINNTATTFYTLLKKIRCENFDITNNIANINTKYRDINGDTLLHFVIENNIIDIFKLIVESGIDLNCTNKYGQTPLIYATQKNRYEYVDILLINGADPNIEDESGIVPLVISIIHDYDDIKDILLKHGAINNVSKIVHSYYNTFITQELWDKVCNIFPKFKRKNIAKSDEFNKICLRYVLWLLRFKKYGNEIPEDIDYTLQNEIRCRYLLWRDRGFLHNAINIIMKEDGFEWLNRNVDRKISDLLECDHSHKTPTPFDDEEEDIIMIGRSWSD